MPDLFERHKQNVIWARCEHAAQLDQVAAIEDLLRKDGDAVRFICTLPDPAQTDALVSPTSQRAVRKFIFEHRPIAVLWIGGALDHAVLTPCHAVDLPIVLLEAIPEMLNSVHIGWLPNRTRTNLSRIHSAFVTNDGAKTAFEQAGVPAQAIRISGSLDDTSTVLPYREDDRIELAQALGTRPVWLAAAASANDVSILCTAHREAARRAHRLLLIIAPQSFEAGQIIADRCRDLGWNTALRSEGAEPEEATQVFIADEEDEMGLWYRIAPISFLCGTFGTGPVDDPFHPAALGSVSIHGPVFGKYKRHFDNLLSVGATLPISNPADLGEAVAAMLAVDKAAEKANAGWDVTSRGAGALALICATLQNLVDGEVA